MNSWTHPEHVRCIIFDEINNMSPQGAGGDRKTPISAICLSKSSNCRLVSANKRDQTAILFVAKIKIFRNESINETWLILLLSSSGRQGHFRFVATWFQLSHLPPPPLAQPVIFFLRLYVRTLQPLVRLVLARTVDINLQSTRHS